MCSSTGSRAVRTYGSRRRGESSAQAGFTLLEILVAFAVLVLMLGALLPAFSGGLRSLDAADSYVHAVLLAQSRIEMIGSEVPLEEGDRQGILEDGFQWVAEVRPVTLTAEARDEYALPFDTFTVVVTVFKDGGPRVRLETLRLAPIALQP